MTGAYDDIIDRPHHVSATRPQMPMSDRAAQFSPFAALTGHDAAIQETGRLTDEKIRLDESELCVLDRELQQLLDRLDDEPAVTITYFEPDKTKSGGAYLTVAGTVKKVDAFERKLLLQDGTIISLSNVVRMQVDGNTPEY